MNQADLVKAVAGAAATTQDNVDGVLKALAAVVHEELGAGGEVTLLGIGKLKVHTRPATAARKGRNPRTGEAIDIPAKPAVKVPHFSAAKALKDATAG